MSGSTSIYHSLNSSSVIDMQTGTYAMLLFINSTPKLPRTQIIAHKIHILTGVVDMVIEHV